MGKIHIHYQYIPNKTKNKSDENNVFTNCMSKQQSFDFQTFVRLLKQALPYRLLFILACVLAIILAPLRALRPYFINKMVDGPIANADFHGIWMFTLLLFGLLVGEAVIRYIFIYSTSYLGQSIIKDLRIKVFTHLLRLKVKYFDKTPIGQSTTRTINDIESINRVFSEGLISIVAEILGLIAVLVMMFLTSWKLTLIVLISFPILIYGTYLFKEAVRISYQNVRTEISRMNAFLQERISGMRIVQIFSAEKQEQDKFKEINRAYTQAYLDSIFYYAIFFPFVELMSAISLGLLVWYGAGNVLEGKLTLGVLIAFPIYINMLYRPVRMLADKFNTLQMGLVAAERVFNVIDNKSKIQDSGDIEVDKINGKVEFKDVSFAYNDENWVLEDVGFTIKPGETMAIVGSTGSGKTTIINLLNRFYDIQNGDILIDGEELKSYKLDSIRQRMAIVLQDVFLFTGTIMENITLQDERISRETVIEASKIIGAHPFIERLPDSYEFKVTERGNNLSMGQRQLISFVRALVFRPNILILDEATSSIDTETEAVIQYAIEKLIEKRTSIIIAHRLSTIRHADHILVLDKGKVAEWGSHEELLKNENGIYQHLYQKQFVQPAQSA